VLPFVVAAVIALGIAPSLRSAMAAGRHVRLNWRGEALVAPFGVLVLAAATVALVPLALIAQLGKVSVFEPSLGIVVVYAVGVGALGLIDDTLGGGGGGRGDAGDGEDGEASGPRGWRGHGAAVLGGAFSTGALKAAGSLGLALFVSVSPGRSTADFLLSAGVLVLATNFFNLLDLRPGRAVKAFVLLAAGLTIGTMDLGPLKAIGLLSGPVLIAGLYDLRERAMLGDTGSNLIGALAGLWLVLSLKTTGLAVALVVLAALTAYGEFRSISAFVERTPGFRHLDSIGRIPHA
jgi:UDP-GlcNAc:undecaprenyl-phosphate/decaprenyl-phosphate GlcNAc-1-phosphate transferase